MIAGMVSRISSLVWASALLFAAGCKSSGSDADDGLDMGSGMRDEGSVDTGGGQVGDAQPKPEAGASEDAGSVADAAPITDSGAEEDSGVIATHGCAGTHYKLCEDFESAGSDGMPSGWTRVFPYWPDPSSANAAEVFVSND